MQYSINILTALIGVAALTGAADAQSAGTPPPAYAPLPSQVQRTVPIRMPNDQPAQSSRIGAPSQPSTATFAPVPAPVAPPPPPIPGPLPPR